MNAQSFDTHFPLQERIATESPTVHHWSTARQSHLQSDADRVSRQETPSRWGAMLRSFVVPGWGNHYADSGDWRLGKYHLGAEVVLLAAYLGINRQAYVVEKNMYTHAAAYSGTDIRDRERRFELAVGNYGSLDEYNDFQERTRNFDRLFPDKPEYHWEWESEELRSEYMNLRNSRNELEQQLPALLAIMVVNRVVSGISAYNRARNVSDAASTSVSVVPGVSAQGLQARISIPF